MDQMNEPEHSNAEIIHTRNLHERPEEIPPFLIGDRVDLYQNRMSSFKNPDATPDVIDGKLITNPDEGLRQINDFSHCSTNFGHKETNATKNGETDKRTLSLDLNNKNFNDKICDKSFVEESGEKFTKNEEYSKELIGDPVNEILLKKQQQKFLNKTRSTTSGEKEKILQQQLKLVCSLIHDLTHRARDPPDQTSVYIPPDNSNHELYRLSTFFEYPQEVPVNPRHLASAGFYYTSYKDWVECFSCGFCVENGVFGDDMRSAKWHRSDCNFARHLESDNVPIGGGGLARFTASLKHHDTMEIVQPANFTASSGTARNVQQTSQQPSAGSVLLSSSSNQSVPMQTARSVQSNQAPSSVFQIVEFATIPSAYHENFLKNLDLRKESERFRTFEHWPSETPTVYLANLAKSGFFYLGNLDRVQCFSCGGVMEHLNYGNNVNYEHRRHFPYCKLCQDAEPWNVPLTPDERAAAPPPQMVLHEPPDPSENEARDLRNMFQCRFPVSPHMRNEDTRLERIQYGTASARAPSPPPPPPPIIDPQAELQRERQKIRDAMNSENVKAAMEMGFEQKVIRHIVKRRIRRSEMCNTVEELVDDITNNTSDASDSDDDEEETQATPTSAKVPGTESIQSMQTRILELENATKCKICLDNTADRTFLPCAHLCSCGRCAEGLKRCPMCRKKIKKEIRTYLS